MSTKEKILESWIMVEHLSEGDINKNDKSLLGFDDLKEKDYYTLFQTKIEEKRFRANQKGGIAVYFDIFEFKEVVEFLRQKYHLAPPEEEVKTGFKFGLVLYFDKNLNFLDDMTFFTESAYIRYFEEVPKEEKFHEYETELKTKIGQFFEESAGNPEKFNQAMEKVLTLQKVEIRISDCKMQLLNNIESDATNLHSFFIADLEAAKTLSTSNLDKYLLGHWEDRVNLDSKSDSKNFNSAPFKEILQPENYPLGRFPSNTKYALSFMQQVAVNLSIGYDNNQIRSVNGPPGTGKTTLLKDIFAELVVQQAYDICNLPEKCIKGTPETKYFKNATVGVIPEHIAEKSIVVASSNNGAVQNIVNELPLISGIDENLIEELKEADYFREISNSSIVSEWNGGEKHTEIVPNEEELFWGLFSLEGGKADNMSNIISNLKAVVNYLDNDYEEEEDIYDEFVKQYQEVDTLRKKMQSYAEAHDRIFRDKEKLRKIETSYIKAKESRAKAVDDARVQSDKLISHYNAEIRQWNQRLQVAEQDIAANEQEKKEVMQYLQMLNGNKPGMFAKREIKEQYDRNVSEAQTRLGQITQKGMEYAKRAQESKKQIPEIQLKLTQEKNKLQEIEQKLKVWSANQCGDIEKLRNRIEMTDKKLGESGINTLKMDLPYDELQLSNPWFREEYRIAQSKLFIMALRVRKQFLYENRKNINAATIIWNKQNEYLDNKMVVEVAWNWINMTVPVISSTFASFSRMCKNLNKNTIGHLFIDEAGQALPQAGVGAIFRSRHVMVVGDPAQIKPVLTMDANVLKMLGKHFEVSEKYLSESASTQTLTDAVSKFGYYRDKDKEDDSWIGIPLWVHRRCQYPMFTISNRISYGDLMVQGAPGNGKTGWYDVKGKANNKYVEEQGEFLLQIIREMMKENPKIKDKNEKDEIYVISPFANVAYRLSHKLKEIGFTRFDGKGKPTNVGTVHTFQGKEAPIVFMVLGADTQSSGAARWAVGEPNMMNVAATRAKKEFYIIGDKELYLGIGCEVATETYNVIRKYKKEHPEKVFERLEPESVEREEEGATPEVIESVQKDNTTKKSTQVESAKVESAQVESAKVESLEAGMVRYIGNRLNQSFHRLDCKYAPRNLEKRVEFCSKDEALKMGYCACKTCNP